MYERMNKRKSTPKRWNPCERMFEQPYDLDNGVSLEESCFAKTPSDLSNDSIPFEIPNTNPATPVFEEYWLGLELQYDQLRQYFHILDSHKDILLSCSRSRVGMFSPKTVLASLKMCCDHPCLSKFKGSRNVSVKFRFIEALISKVKEQRKRLVVLYNDVEADAGNTSLYSLISKTFDFTVHEHVNRYYTGTGKSKQEVLDRFNDKDFDRRVLFLEKKSCRKDTVKLIDVDMVVVLNNDWIGSADMERIQKVQFVSPRTVKILRLFCVNTVEENLGRAASSFLKPFETWSSDSCRWLLRRRVESLLSHPTTTANFQDLNGLADLLCNLSSTPDNHLLRTFRSYFIASSEFTEVALLETSQTSHQEFWSKFLQEVLQSPLGYFLSQDQTQAQSSATLPLSEDQIRFEDAFVSLSQDQIQGQSITLQMPEDEIKYEGAIVPLSQDQIQYEGAIVPLSQDQIQDQYAIVTLSQDQIQGQSTAVKRKRGRPPGSKNKKKKEGSSSLPPAAAITSEIHDIPNGSALASSPVTPQSTNSGGLRTKLPVRRNPPFVQLMNEVAAGNPQGEGSSHCQHERPSNDVLNAQQQQGAAGLPHNYGIHEQKQYLNSSSSLVESQQQWSRASASNLIAMPPMNQQQWPRPSASTAMPLVNQQQWAHPSDSASIPMPRPFHLQQDYGMELSNHSYQAQMINHMGGLNYASQGYAPRCFPLPNFYGMNGLLFNPNVNQDHHGMYMNIDMQMHARNDGNNSNQQTYSHTYPSNTSSGQQLPSNTYAINASNSFMHMLMQPHTPNSYGNNY